MLTEISQTERVLLWHYFYVESERKKNFIETETSLGTSRVPGAGVGFGGGGKSKGTHFRLPEKHF